MFLSYACEYNLAVGAIIHYALVRLVMLVQGVMNYGPYSATNWLNIVKEGNTRHASFYDTARVLDDKRLGKQRVEALQILNVVMKPPEFVGGWVNHPAVNMWRGYEGALKIYTNCMIIEWERRGYQNTMQYYDVHGVITFPWWLGDPRLHESHQSNLLRKFPEYYSTLGWHVPTDLPYFWPVEGRPKPQTTKKVFARSSET